MDFRLLGHLEVEAEGALLDLGPPKQRAVLVALLLNANTAIPTDRLIDLVWGDEPPRTAGHSIQLYVSELRKALAGCPAAAIETKPPGYLLQTDPDSIDVHRFRRLVEQGAGLADRHECEAAVDALRQALDLWRGSPLADFAYEDFAQPHIRTLEELHLTAEVQLAAAELELGRLWSVLPSLEAIIAAHPLRERPVELYMLALYRQGRQADALRAYEEARTRLVEELGIDPSPELGHLAESILRQDPGLLAAPAARPAWSGNLPADITSFVGRVDELAELQALAPGSRLLTLLGPGGIGKSRLAIELARRLEPGFADGAWLVEFGTVVDPGSIVDEIAALWAEPASPGKPTLEDLAKQLHDRQALLVLDNCESIAAEAALVAERLLVAAPALHILATSREPLECRGEVLWRVGPLRFAGDGEPAPVPAVASEAVELFATRARDAVPGFALDAASAAAATRICALLEGIPLAIELAASRLRGITLSELEGRLDDRLGVLVTSDRTVPARQRTLQQTIEWSYDLLDGMERELFARCGDFWVEFPLRAAEVACADELVPEHEIAPLLERLTDKSLVGRVERGGRTWYRLLETIRFFAFMKLVSNPVNIHQCGFLMHLAARTDRTLLGSVDEMWATLLDGDADVARQTLTVAANSFREEQGGELAGAIAALVSKTRRIGFIAGMNPSDYPATGDRLDSLAGTQGIMARFRDGFRAGAYGRDPQIEIVETFLTDEPNFARAFQNPVGAGKEAAALYEQGVDVIFHAAGGASGHRIFEMARRVTEDTGLHRWVIGVDFDEFRDIEEHLRPHVLASIRKQVPMAVYRQIKRAVAEGRAETAPRFDLSNGGLTLATSGGHIDHLAAELAALHADMLARDAVP